MPKRPTKADLDAANREVNDLRRQLSILREERKEAEVLVEQEDDRKIVNWFVANVREMRQPPNVMLCAATVNPLGRAEVTSLSVIDLQRVATALDRLAIRKQ